MGRVSAFASVFLVLLMGANWAVLRWDVTTANWALSYSNITRRYVDRAIQPLPAPCQPKRRIVFVKTHKTGSSTVTTLLERYAYNRGLNFALPGRTHVFSQFDKFSSSKAYLADLRDGNGSLVMPALGGYHILANHARYNRPEQAALIPGAFYLTIIREPVQQLESAFNFFRMSRYVPHGNLSGVLQTPAESFYRSSNSKPMGFLRNGQLYDLGLEQTSQDEEAVAAKIQALDREMDLVMIMEYFDESLLLLRKLLCLELADIVYMSQLVRKPEARTQLSAELAGQMRAWNHADVRLYRHFNASFWEKVRAYGTGFQGDLAAFRALRENATRTCLQGAKVVLDKHKTSSHRLSANASTTCKDLVRSDTSWVRILRRELQQRTTAFLEKRTGPTPGNASLS